VFEDGSRGRRDREATSAYWLAMEAKVLLAQLRILEVMLHQPAVRSDPEKLARLLHERFREFGRSGRIYTRGEILSEFSQVPPAYEVWSQDFQAELLSEGVVLLTYRSAHINRDGELERHTNRASLWQQTEHGWQLLFHQATPTGPFPRDATESTP
jgi:hypothetical protein